MHESMNKNLRRKTYVVTAQTAYNIQRLAQVCGCPEGRIIDKLVREKMLALRVEKKEEK